MQKYILILAILFLLIQLNAYADDLVINEIFYDPGDTGLGCFVELYGKPNLKLDGYRLVGINGNGGGEYNVIDMSGQKVSSTGYFVVAEDKSVPDANLIDSKADYQNGPDSIELWNKEEKIDAVGYGDFTKSSFKGEGKPTLDLSGYSIGRRPDGLDSNDNSVDFVGLAIPSPGKSNMPAIAGIEKKRKLTQTWAYIKNNH